MALSDVKVRSAKPEAKAYKLTDGEGMVLLVHPEHLDERRLMLQWWADYLDVNWEKVISPFDYGHHI
ncbi:hypothetical protein EDF75_4631 [Raoultella sp. BIGb0149]|uniref:integrase family protein n=1 Tax=Raoultella sp. BIGb0149 TaxID=2485116 RepID=UPI00105CD560|nr:integrase family protein [Raoultella sp. BIGb0149]TDQ20171.1 hypothetical protein EDF75_4631 [Raoultella sp. BIGb0149]